MSTFKFGIAAVVLATALSTAVVADCGFDRGGRC